jgi:hypothetical protein
LSSSFCGRRAVDLAPGAGGSQSATPSDLLVDLSPANGATLDTIAARLSTDLRGSGVTGNIEQMRFVLAGGDALGIRYATAAHDLDGKEIVSAVTDYIASRGTRSSAWCSRSLPRTTPARL